MGKPLTFLLPERYHAASRKWLGEAEPPDQLLLEERRRGSMVVRNRALNFPRNSPLGLGRRKRASFLAVFAGPHGTKRSEQVQSQLAAIVESSNDPIISNSLDGTIVTWNAAAERLYGYAAEEAKGRPIAMLAPAIARRSSTILARLRAGKSSRL